MDEAIIFNLGNIPEDIAKEFRTRIAVRAVVVDGENNVGILHSQKLDYLELPGGKVEVGESREGAIVRECKEEIGSDVTPVQGLGVTKEYRRVTERINESTGFLSKVIAKNIDFIPDGEDEAKFDMEVIWISIDEAIQRLKESKSEEVATQQAFLRDLYFLEAAKRFLK